MKKWDLFDREALDIIIPNGQVVEVRGFLDRGKMDRDVRKVKRAINSAWFNDNDLLIEVVKKWLTYHDRICTGLYFTPNELNPLIMSRSASKFSEGISATSDKDILNYVWLLVDLDGVRPAGVPSPDTMLLEAMNMLPQVAGFVRDHFSIDLIIEACSGNGAHLMGKFPEKLAVSAETTAYVRSILEILSEEFDTPTVKVDQKVYNPARIWKFYGSTARKGDEMPDQPHRKAFIYDLGGDNA